MKTFWLSFCDSKKPKGTQFLGVSIIEVSQEEANEELENIMINFPNAQENAEWTAAATTKAWKNNCNPGGEVLSIEIPEDLISNLNNAPRNTLLSKDDLIDLGYAPKSLEESNVQ